jgi:hypothetical protein
MNCINQSLLGKFLGLFILIYPSNIFSQTMDLGEKDWRLFLITDVKAASATNDSASSANTKTGTGSLGVTFKKNYFYGSVLFNVINKNPTLSTNDTSATKLFANNLLTPENSGEGINNFHLSFGIKSFYDFKHDFLGCKTEKSDLEWDKISFLNWKRLGVFGFWQVNNTIWRKDTVSIPVYISSGGLFVTYDIVSVKLIGENNDKMHFSWYGGFESRTLGGDYGLTKNSTARMYFLGTDKIKFRTFPATGFKLELGKFYGKIEVTHFGDGDINGFSGWQTVISLGLNVDLNIAAQSTSPNME